MAADIRQDIEELLKEAIKEIKKYRKTFDFNCAIEFLLSRKVFYKVKGGDIEHPYVSHSFSHLTKALGRNPDWILLVDTTSSCLGPCSLNLFISDYNLFHISFYEPLIEYVQNSDPLIQILEYHDLMKGHRYLEFPQRSYFCLEVFLVPSSSSLFGGKEGVVAYCTTLTNFLRLLYNRDIYDYIDKISEIYHRAYKIIDKELNELWLRNEKEFKAYCHDVKLTEYLVHNEIEEAEKLNKEYGIIRVAFPFPLSEIPASSKP